MGNWIAENARKNIIERKDNNEIANTSRKDILERKSNYADSIKDRDEHWAVSKNKGKGILCRD